MQLHEIYSEYKTLPNLITHMLRVGALAHIVLKNWTGIEINKDAILKTCLLHDIAKPVTFDMSKQQQYVKNEEELRQIEECNNFLISNFGEDEHKALEKIGVKIGLKDKTLQLLNNLEWLNIRSFIEKNDVESLIPIYCDMRISPNGIVTIDERIKDLKKRTGKEDQQQYIDGKDLERLINENVSIDLELITNEEINKKIEELKDLHI